MSEFKIIETQEELNEVIKDRINREREKYADYEQLKSDNAKLKTDYESLNQQFAELTSKSSNYDSEIATLNSKVKAYETDSAKTRIALEKGLPFEFAKRLSGETEDEINADAEKMAKLFQSRSYTPPQFSHDTTTKDNVDLSLRELAKSLTK